MNKRELKMMGKSDLKIQIQKEEEKRAFKIDDAVLQKVEEMRYIFPFLYNVLKDGATQSYLTNLGVQKV